MMSIVERPVRAMADRVARVRLAGQPVVVVVSATGAAGQRLYDLAAAFGPVPPAREVDQLLATSECASAALLAMALQQAGVPAVALTGDQAGIVAAGKPGDGVVASVWPDRVERLLAEGTVVVVGLHGVNAQGDIVALGRAGCDALATGLGTDVQVVHTDVDGGLAHGGSPCR